VYVIGDTYRSVGVDLAVEISKSGEFLQVCELVIVVEEIGAARHHRLNPRLTKLVTKAARDSTSRRRK